MLRFVDFFAGIGGASLGLKKAGLQLVDALEVSGKAKSVYKKNLGLFPKGDLMSVPTHGLNGKADLFFASFPFKEMSKSFNCFIGEDPEDFVSTNLYFYFFDFVAYYKPRYLIIEIVKNITKTGERHLNIIYKILAQLGFNTSTFCLNYREYGLPIYKETVFLIATPQNELRFELEMPKIQPIVVADFLKKENIARKQIIRPELYKILDLPLNSPRHIYYTGYMKNRKKGEDDQYFSRTFPYHQRIYSDSGFFPCFHSCEKEFRYFVYEEVNQRVIKLSDRQCYKMKGFSNDFRYNKLKCHRCSQLAYASSPAIIEWLGLQLVKHASSSIESLLGVSP